MKSLLSKRSAAIQYFKKFFASKNDIFNEFSVKFCFYKVCWKCLHQCFSYLFLNYIGICKISHESTEKICTFDSADKETYRMLAARRDQYKHAALKAKHTGDITTATQHVKVAKVTIGTSTSRICSYKCSSCRGFLCV